MTRAEIRREAALRSSMALDIAFRLTTDRRLVRKIARLLLISAQDRWNTVTAMSPATAPYGHEQKNSTPDTPVATGVSGFFLAVQMGDSCCVISIFHRPLPRLVDIQRLSQSIL
jgi:hypothetical protein